jgi:LSD1 subclass zinc finger protein
LYFFSIVPIAIAYRTQENVKAADALRSQLAAKVGAKGGALECRQCRAPLSVQTGVLAARCVYCETDNLVTVTSTEATVAKKKARNTHLAVQEELAAHHRVQAEDRKNMWAMLLAGPLLVPLVMLGGLLLHALGD